MLHLVYITAFTIVAFLAVSNLIRSLITLSIETQRVYPPTAQSNRSTRNLPVTENNRSRKQVHPELLDQQGKLIDEPLLVMRSVSVEDARQKLDALYDSSPNKTDKEE